MTRIGVAAFLGLLLTSSGAEAHKPTTTKFTYHRDILPIFATRCGSCHRTGGPGPMSLLSYEDAHPWAFSIKNEILSLAMPPWYVDERFGRFQHAPALTAREIDIVVDWCIGGSPEGEPSSVPDVERASAAWRLGAPDLTLSPESAFTMEADENEAIHEMTLPSGLDRPRYLRAFDFRPESANIARWALVYAGDGAGEERLLGVWLPDEEPFAFDPGRGIPISAGASIVVRVYYKKTWLDEGSEVEDRSALALYFHRGPVSQAVETVEVGPKGAHELQDDVDLLALVPRIAEGGADIVLAEMVGPDGSRSTLLRLNGPRPEWPRKYRLREPLRLPAGSQIEISAPHVLLLDVVRRQGR